MEHEKLYFYVISSLKDWKVNMWFSFDLIFFIYRLSTFPERFMYKVIEFLQPYFTQDTYLMFDSLHDDNAECIDTFTLFEYLQKHNIKSYYIVNKNNKTFEKIKKYTKLKNVIIVNNKKYIPFYLFIVLIKTHTVITSFGHSNNKFEKFLYRNSRIKYVFCNHGITLMKLFPVKCLYTPSRFNYFVTSNALEENMLIDDAGWSINSLIRNGFLRFDKLKKTTIAEKKEIFMMFTWRKYLNSNNFFEADYFSKINSLLNNDKFIKLVKKNNIKIKFGLHHHLVKRLCLNKHEFNFLNNINVEMVEMTEISEQIPKTSLFITDFSSIVFDFMYLDIPVIFYRFDADLDEKIREIESINYAMSKDKYLYNCCYSEEDTVKTIIKYIQNGFILEEENKEKNKQFYSYIERGNVCKNFVNIMDNINKNK